MSKYSKLRDFLLSSGRDVVDLSFDEIAEIIGSKLPVSAFKYRAWWANDTSHTHARNGWLAAGYNVDYVDLDSEIVVFIKKYDVPMSSTDEIEYLLGSLESQKGLSHSSKSAREFEKFAKEVMSRYFGVRLEKRRKSGWPKEFDLVSPDYRIVGDAKYYTMIRGERLPPAKFSTISEHVWMLENIDADTKFLVFGNDKRVPLEWLKRYGYLVKTVKFYFIDENGNVEELR